MLEMGGQRCGWRLNMKTEMSTCMGLGSLAVWIGAEGRKRKLSGHMASLSP